MLSKNLQKSFPYLVLCISVAIAMLVLTPGVAHASNGKSAAAVVGVIGAAVAAIIGFFATIRSRM